MSRLGESLCIALNSRIKKYPSYACEGERYNDAEYREVARDFDTFYGKYNLDFTDKLVLDAGCGLGGKTVYYARQGCKHIYGVDMDMRHIEKSEEFAEENGIKNATFQTESLENMSFESDTFDLIFLNGVLEHIVRDKLKPALSELKRVLKPGGRILIEFPPWTAPYAAHFAVIYIPWCQYLFSDETLVNVVNTLAAPQRGGDLSFIEHFMELNRCTIAEFKRMIEELDFDVVDIDLNVVRKMNFLKKIPFFNRFFIRSVHAVLSKVDPCPTVPEPHIDLGNSGPPNATDTLVPTGEA